MRKQTWHWAFTVLAVGSLAAAVGCGDDDTDQKRDDTKVGETLVLSLDGVEPLAGGLHYEGWAIIDGEPVTTGKFNVLADGTLVDLEDNAIAGGEFATGRDLSGAAMIVLSIEPDGDTDTIPATTKYLAGALEQGGASLVVGAEPTLGDDFSAAAGTYILATPTDGTGEPENERSGVWFLDPAAGPGVGLDLPQLPSGWVYEGWVVVDGTPITTGKFSDPASADDSAPFSGESDGPPFPGEDLLSNAPDGATFPVDLRGAKAVVSVEPDPDDSPAPFAIKPLVGDIPADAEDHTAYALENKSAGLPSGSATVK